MMGDIISFKRPKPLKGFIPDDINDPICCDCRPDGALMFRNVLILFHVKTNGSPHN